MPPSLNLLPASVPSTDRRLVLGPRSRSTSAVTRPTLEPLPDTMAKIPCQYERQNPVASQIGPRSRGGADCRLARAADRSQFSPQIATIQPEFKPVFRAFAQLRPAGAPAGPDGHRETRLNFRDCIDLGKIGFGRRGGPRRGRSRQPRARDPGPRTPHRASRRPPPAGPGSSPGRFDCRRRVGGRVRRGRARRGPGGRRSRACSGTPRGRPPEVGRRGPVAAPPSGRVANRRRASPRTPVPLVIG